jgi:glycosyltransferase involved in cell wall biosynthesis
MDRRPFRELLTNDHPADRIFYTNLWFKGHNNPRYAELLPRLSRLDRYLVMASDKRIPRGLQYRAYRWTRLAREPALLALASRRYNAMFTTDNRQIPWFSGPIVADVDDPYYTAQEVAWLNRPNVSAYVVTAERAATRFESLGVEKPYHVIPQGISLTSLTPELLTQAAQRRRPGEFVVGWMAAHLLSAGDRDGHEPLYNVDHLLELWEAIHSRAPHARLWLIGGASQRVEARVAGRDDILLFGRLPREEALAAAASFDLALYPRTKDQGIQAAKVGEFIGLGIPTVSYDYAVTENLRETGAGVLVETPADFVDAVVRISHDEAVRAPLAASARKAAPGLDWDVLAQRYEDEILSRYLPY